MPYPAGLITRDVSFGQAVVLESGSPLIMRVTIEASRSLLHRPTGSPLVSTMTFFQSGDLGSRTLSLPVTDSEDMGLGNGQPIALNPGEATHLYTATMEYLDAATMKPLPGEQPRVVGPFALPTGDGSVVDLDDLRVVEAPAEGIPVDLTLLATEKGQPGGVAALDVSGNVIDSEGDILITEGDLALALENIRPPDLSNYATKNDLLPLVSDDDLSARLETDLASLRAHVADTNNPHATTKQQVGLGNANNTSDASKPVSTATQAALNLLAVSISDGDTAALAQARAYADAINVDLRALIALAEESEDVDALAVSVQALADAPAGVTQEQLQAEATARTDGDNASLSKAANLSDVPSPSTARTSLGLGSAATRSAGDFEATGVAQTIATAERANNRSRTNHTGTQSADTVFESGSKKWLTTTERAKIAAISSEPTWVPQVGSWYGINNGNVASGGLAGGTQVIWPFTLDRTIITNTLAVENTNGATGGTIRWGLYFSDPVTGLPDLTTLVDFGTIATDVASGKTLTRTGDVTLAAGRLLYLTALPLNNAPAIRMADVATPEFPLPLNVTSAPTSGSVKGYRVVGTRTDLATAATEITWVGTTQARAHFKVAA